MQNNKDIEILREVDENGEFEDIALVRNLENKTIIDTDKLNKMKQYQANKRDYDNFIDIAGGFSFMLVDTLKELHKDTRFTDSEKARIIFLGTYCSYETSGRYLLFNNNKYILKSHLQELLEISNKKEFYTFYNKMVETRIIEEDYRGRFEIRLKWSSDYHFKGKASKNGTKSINTVKTYDRQIQSLYKEKGTNGKSINTPKNLYIMFMVLPFINKESGVLCNNPLVDDEEDSQPLELTDLAEMFGYPKPSMIKNKLLKCKLFGTNVFFVGDGMDMKKRRKYTRIFVNPFVASRSPKAPNPTLLALFPDTEKVLSERLKAKQNNKSGFFASNGEYFKY